MYSMTSLICYPTRLICGVTDCQGGEELVSTHITSRKDILLLAKRSCILRQNGMFFRGLLRKSERASCEKTYGYAGWVGNWRSFKAYLIPSICLRRDRGGSWASARRLATGEVRKAPVTTRREAWCTESRRRLLNLLAHSYTKLA